MGDGGGYYAIGWEGTKPSNCMTSSNLEGDHAPARCGRYKVHALVYSLSVEEGSSKALFIELSCKARFLLYTPQALK
jgi:hypothetical protein